MTFFNYEDSPYSIREEIKQAHREYWQKLANPGSWWTGEQRIAIAAQVRNALCCDFCDKRKTALSPNSIKGEHNHSSKLLDLLAIDAVHRIVTDQGRITQTYVNDNTQQGLSEEAYVELAGIAVTVFSIDEFSRGLGLSTEALPTAIAGDCSHYRPAQAITGTGFVAMIPPDGATGKEADLWPNGMGPNVLRALSLVPDAVRCWTKVSSAQYLSMAGMANFVKQDDRSINRMQMELVAGRVSAINECFY